MKTLFLCICLMFLFAGAIHAEEGESNSTDNLCQGYWTLSNQAGWVIRNKEGVVLPLSASTVVFGCGKIPVSLEKDLSGVSVDARCAPSPVENGLPDVVSISIVCE